MADYKKKSETKEIGIGLLFLLLLVVVFIIWVLTGGPDNKVKQKTLFQKTDFSAQEDTVSNTDKTGFRTTTDSTGYGITEPTTNKK